MGISENGPTGSVVALTSPGSKDVPTGYAALVDGSAVMISPAIALPATSRKSTNGRIVLAPEPKTSILDDMTANGRLNDIEKSPPNSVLRHRGKNGVMTPADEVLTQLS